MPHDRTRFRVVEPFAAFGHHYEPGAVVDLDELDDWRPADARDDMLREQVGAGRLRLVAPATIGTAADPAATGSAATGSAA